MLADKGVKSLLESFICENELLRSWAIASSSDDFGIAVSISLSKRAMKRDGEGSALHPCEEADRKSTTSDFATLEGRRKKLQKGNAIEEPQRQNASEATMATPIERSYTRYREVMDPLLSNQEKFELEVHRILEREEAKMREKKVCLSCWLLEMNCICAEVVKLPCRHKVIVLMHYKEFGRPSNTGKLLTLGLRNAELLRFGHREDMERLYQIIPSHPNHNESNVCLLFPSEDAIPVGEFLRQQDERREKSQSREEPNSSREGEEEPRRKEQGRGLVIIVVDGTWNQARRMVKSLPGSSMLPRVAIESTAISLFNPIRRQTEPGRICTLEALVICLESLGDVSPSLSKRMLWYLQLLVDRMIFQSHLEYYRGTYGTLSYRWPSPSPDSSCPFSLLALKTIRDIAEFLDRESFLAFVLTSKTARKCLLISSIIGEVSFRGRSTLNISQLPPKYENA